MSDGDAGAGLELALHGRRSDWRGAKAQAEAERWGGLLAPLALAMPAIAPPAGLDARIGGAVDRAGTDLDETVEERLEEGSWREIAPGVEVKPLWDDRTFLVRCGPGGVFVETRPIEDIVILHGEIAAGGEGLEAGDYRRTPAGSAEGAITSRTGVLMLVRYR